jgi:hypothetical protein
MTSRFWISCLGLVVLSSPACGGGTDENRAADPRCISLCTVGQPEVEGAFDVCSEASAEQCQQECSARIADTETLCASCLLEDACFAPDCGGSDDPDFCDSSGQCTVSGREGTCTYSMGDEAARADCLRQVFPRRSVECTTEYRSLSECSAECTTDGSPSGGSP